MRLFDIRDSLGIHKQHLKYNIVYAVAYFMVGVVLIFVGVNAFYSSCPYEVIDLYVFMCFLLEVLSLVSFVTSAKEFYAGFQRRKKVTYLRDLLVACRLAGGSLPGELFL